MTAKKIVLATLGAVLVAGAAIPAFAAPDRPDRGPGRHGMMRDAMMKEATFVRLLKTADTNKDGRISKEEVTARIDTLFTEIDANKDGSITRGELLDYRIAKRDEFRKANPRPEMAENDEGRPERPRAEREDGDGPRGERAERRERRHERFERARYEHHGHRMGGGRFFRMIDEDRDGKITKAEATAAGDKLFARMDTNKDNVISIDDLPDRPL